MNLILYLHGVCGTFVSNVCGVTFCDTSCQRISNAVVGFPGRFHPRQTCGIDSNCHIGQHKSDSLMFGDGFAKSFPLESVFCRFVKSSLRQTNSAGRNLRNIHSSLSFRIKYRTREITGGRVLSNAPIAILKPAPSPINTFSFGTRTSSKVTIRVSDALCPMLIS